MNLLVEFSNLALITTIIQAQVIIILIFYVTGHVGISLDGQWMEPLDPDSSADREAAERSFQFSLGMSCKCVGPKFRK